MARSHAHACAPRAIRQTVARCACAHAHPTLYTKRKVAGKVCIEGGHTGRYLYSA